MSDLIVWDPSMSVGVAILDEDHRRIMKMINRLYTAIQEGKGRKVLGEIFHDMMVYISLHFECEEALFEETGYPGMADQKKDHLAMAARAMEIKSAFDQDPNAVMPMDIMYFLKDWWINHIMNADKKYASHLNAHGIH